MASYLGVAVPEHCQQMLEALMLQLHKQFCHASGAMVGAVDVQQQQRWAQVLSHMIKCLVSLSKAFDSSSLQAAGCLPLFLHNLEEFCPLLSIHVCATMLRGAVRTYIHRVLRLLPADSCTIIVPLIPALLDAQHTDDKYKDLLCTVEIFIQVAMQFKAGCGALIDVALVPVLQVRRREKERKEGRKEKKKKERKKKPPENEEGTKGQPKPKMIKRFGSFFFIDTKKLGFIF